MEAVLKSRTSALKLKNMPMLNPSVAAVPARDHQRMACSQPRGKSTSASAKAVGRKTTSDIQMRSVSGMAVPLSAGRGQGDEVGQGDEDAHGGQHQEQDV